MTARTGRGVVHEIFQGDQATSYIGPHEIGPPTGRFDSLDHVAAPLGVAAGHDHTRSFGCEGLGHTAADPAGRSRDQRGARHRIIEGAAAEIRVGGVAGTTLNDIRNRTRTSKSQLFHYFPGGKEQLLLAVAQHEADRVLDDQEPVLSNLTSWSAWSVWRDVVVDRYRRQGQSCPLSALTVRLGLMSPAAHAVTAKLLHKWHEALTRGIRDMQVGATSALDSMPNRPPRRCSAGYGAGSSSC